MDDVDDRSMLVHGSRQAAQPPEGVAALPPGVATALLALTAECSGEVVTVHAWDGRCIHVSPNSATVLGWPPGELEGRPWTEYLHPEDADHAAPTASGMARYRLRRPSGEYRWVETRSCATPDGGYMLRITRDVQREQELAAELERLTRVDPLTGLLNRSGLEEVLVHELDRHRRYRTPLAVLLVDVDGFRAINDARGPDGGDEALRAVGAVVKEEKRSCDFAGRWGEDEFLVVLPETAAEDALVLAQRLRSACAGRLPATLSVGVASAGSGDQLRDLLRRADAAAYAVKSAGGDGVEFFCAPTP